jgi:signal transduction histidine kinase
MALVAAEHDPSSRRRVTAVYVQNGVVGTIVLLAVTLLRPSEPARIIAALGSPAPILIALLALFATSLALLKFKLTEQIFVSFVITAYIAMFPLLGLVLSTWIAIAAAVAQRLLAMHQIGPSKIDMTDARFEWARTFGLFGTYGIPVAAAVLLYEAMGGAIPQLEPTLPAALRIALGGIVMIALNELVVSRVERAYGYSAATSLKLGVIDSSIYLVTIPYAILTTFTYGAMGWGGVLAAAFSGVMVNTVARNLAHIRADREQLIQRLTTLTNIGKTISLDCSTDELLMRVYQECRSFIDATLFSIALHEPSTDELLFELNIEDGELLPKSRIRLGDGLNAWVVTNAKPLLIGSSIDERKLGITSVDDGMPTESWLGVPMIARDRVIGVISIQSYGKNRFTHGDLVLLTAIANQAAAAIENAHLYRDLEGLNIALEQRVQERTVELRETNFHLLAADRSKNQFLASMSHELRTPLNAIIGFSAILLQSTQGLLPPRLFRFLENIKTAGSHLLELINDILDLAKIEAGKVQLQPETFDLQDTIGTVDRVIKGMAAERDVTIVSRIDPAIGSVFLDEGRVKQILLNLLSNAVKFSHRGGFVYLTVAAEAEETIRIDVTDSGIGIAPDELTRIFDEFYQAGRRRTRGGTGLGLSLTKSFVELHNGTIAVASEAGKGSTFTVRLPREVASAGSGLESQLSAPASPVTSRGHI